MGVRGYYRLLRCCCLGQSQDRHSKGGGSPALQINIARSVQGAQAYVEFWLQVAQEPAHVLTKLFKGAILDSGYEGRWLVEFDGSH